jgi:hypothetical protein
LKMTSWRTMSKNKSEKEQNPRYYGKKSFY